MSKKNINVPSFQTITEYDTDTNISEIATKSMGKISFYTGDENDDMYEDMQVRLYKFYDEIEEIETSIEAVETRLYNIKQEKISGDNVYQFLLFFDKLYDRFTDMEKKTFMKSFLEEVNIYEAEQEDGRILKSLKFRFPVFFNDQELYELDWDNESIVETVVLLSRAK